MRYIIKDKTNSNFPYFIKDDNSGVLIPTQSPLVAYKYDTQEEAEQVAKDRGLVDYEIEGVN